jgi:hypothetical protein
VENPDGLAAREDADGFDGIATLVGPSTFFWATVRVPDFVDRDRLGLSFEITVSVIPVTESFCTFDWSFFLPAGEGVHRLKMVAKMKRIPRIKSSTGWRSWID